MTQSGTTTFFVSYPKSGRTWLRLMMAKYLDELTESQTTLEDLDELTVASAIPRIELTHAGANLPERTLLDSSGLIQAYAGQRVLFLTRNFEDTLVSSYFQARYRKGLFNGTLSNFIRNPQLGAVRLRKFFDSWAEARAEAGSFCLISYEEMHADAQLSLSKALVFCGIAKPNRMLLQSAVNYCTFDNLQGMERNNTFSKKAFRARDTSKIETYKFRQGKIGNYVEHLSENDLAFLRDLLVDNQNPLLRSALAESL